jgi:hypothetical protein
VLVSQLTFITFCFTISRKEELSGSLRFLSLHFVFTGPVEYTLDMLNVPSSCTLIIPLIIYFLSGVKYVRLYNVALTLFLYIFVCLSTRRRWWWKLILKIVPLKVVETYPQTELKLPRKKEVKIRLLGVERSQVSLLSN